MSDGLDDLREHVVVCGLTSIALRAVEQLYLSGVPCVVLDDEAEPRLLRQLRQWGVPFLQEQGTNEHALQQAGIKHATAVIAANESDLENLETALEVSSLVENIRVVVQLSNVRLGEELRNALPNVRVLSVPERAAPSLVEACVQSSVLHAFLVGGEPLEVVDVVAPRDGTCRELYGPLTPLTVRYSDNRLPPELCPGRDVEVAAGDRLTLLGRAAEFEVRRVPECDPDAAAELLALSSGRIRRKIAVERRWNPLRRMRSMRATLQAVVGELDRSVKIALGVVAVIIAVSTLLLRLTFDNTKVLDANGQPAEFGWLQALYFTVTVVATVGFGDFSFAHQRPWLVGYGIFLIFVGAAAVATVYALVTNFIVNRRFEQAFGRSSAITASGHVIVVGLGAIGLAVARGLRSVGRDVVVIEADQNNRHLKAARAAHLPLVLGDATDGAVLRQANLRHATAMAVVTSSDLANVETALTARAEYASQASRHHHSRSAQAARDLRVVLRVFDRSRADKLERRFPVNVVRSAAALAAPWFVGAALGYDVVSTFYAQRQPFVVARMRIQPNGGLDGVVLRDMGEGLRVIAASSDMRVSGNGESGEQEPLEVGAHSSHYDLSRHSRLSAGSDVLLVGTYQRVIAAFRQNQMCR